MSRGKYLSFPEVRKKKQWGRFGFPLVIIEWVDASRLAESWIDVADIPNAYLHRCVTVGFVVSSTRDGKILIPTVADFDHPNNSHAYGGMLIPARSIISERTLR